MSRRTQFEAGGNEEDYVKKCMSCKHSYTKQNESDTLFCSCKKGCNYKPKGAEKNG